MRKIIMIILLAVIAANTCEAQEKWRTLTFSALSHTSTQESNFMPQFSAALDYEILDNIAVVSWNGMSYSTRFENSWFASQTTIDQRIPTKAGLFTVGLGYLYTTNGNNLFNPMLQSGVDNDLFLTMKLQYRIKL